ncbi:MAG: hypothetical protein KDA73_01080 [Rhodobacteraceae bacterium]|nr:hypothetical protein [Paracoccaceae bacterium]
MAALGVALSGSPDPAAAQSGLVQSAAKIGDHQMCGAATGPSRLSDARLAAKVGLFDFTRNDLNTVLPGPIVQQCATHVSQTQCNLPWAQISTGAMNLSSPYDTAVWEAASILNGQGNFSNSNLPWMVGGAAVVGGLTKWATDSTLLGGIGAVAGAALGAKAKEVFDAQQTYKNCTQLAAEFKSLGQSMHNARILRPLRTEQDYAALMARAESLGFLTPNVRVAMEAYADATADRIAAAYP